MSRERDRLIALARRSGDGSVTTPDEQKCLLVDWERACAAAAGTDSINLHDDEDLTPAHFLARRATHLQMFDIAAKAGMGFDRPCRTGQNIRPIHSAAVRDSEDDAHAARVIDWLLLHGGADVNSALSTEWQPLHLACTRFDAERVRILIRSGAELETALAPGTRAVTPLLIAASSSTAAVVLELLNAGADATKSAISGSGAKSAYLLALNNDLIRNGDVLNRLKARQYPVRFPEATRRRNR